MLKTKISLDVPIHFPQLMSTNDLWKLSWRAISMVFNGTQPIDNCLRLFTIPDTCLIYNVFKTIDESLQHSVKYTDLRFSIQWVKNRIHPCTHHGNQVMEHFHHYQKIPCLFSFLHHFNYVCSYICYTLNHKACILF